MTEVGDSNRSLYNRVRVTGWECKGAFRGVPCFGCVGQKYLPKLFKLHTQVLCVPTNEVNRKFKNRGKVGASFPQGPVPNDDKIEGSGKKLEELKETEKNMTSPSTAKLSPCASFAAISIQLTAEFNHLFHTHNVKCRRTIENMESCTKNIKNLIRHEKIHRPMTNES